MLERFLDSVHDLLNGPARLTVLTGAGISAESGIPTFRGPEGYWRKGSAVYQPMQLATARMFLHEPLTVWSWYLYRHTVCRAAQPNTAHHALAQLEQRLSKRFTLVTQNVDGLHLRAGSSMENTLPIHGQIDRMRCANACTDAQYPIPESLHDWPAQQALDENLAQENLRCPDCGGPTRPHILWFDECYDQTHYHFDSAIRRAAQADMLWIIGTSGQTNLPRMLVDQALRLGTQLVEINPDPSDFSASVSTSGGLVIRETACGGLAPLAKILAEN